MLAYSSEPFGMCDLAKTTVHRCFLMFDRIGLHVLPKHYYSPIPDFRWLKTHKPFWATRARLAGIRWDLELQLKWLKEISVPYYDEVRGLASYSRLVESDVGLGYGPIESQVLHCFMRKAAPSRVIEIGSGVSTSCITRAAELNRSDNKPVTSCACIDPHPRESLRFNRSICLIQKPLQEIPLSVFDELGRGDLLFVDSTHSVKTGSDVVKIYLEIIPRLAPGVYVQIHDIYLPYLYPRHALLKFFSWQETALLTALLVNNEHLNVLCCLSALHYDRTNELRMVLADYQPQTNDEGLQTSRVPSGHFPSSMWLQTE